MENAPSQRECSTNFVDTENLHDMGTEVDKESSLGEGSLPTLSKEPVAGTSTTLEKPTIVTATTNDTKQPRKIAKKRKAEDEFLRFMKERHESRQQEMEVQTTRFQPMDEISSFSQNIEISLRKLSARSRSLAKSEIFNIVSKYELIDIEFENSRSPYASSLSNNTTLYSPTPIQQQEHETTLLDLSSSQIQFAAVPQLEDISTELQNVLNDQQFM